MKMSLLSLLNLIKIFLPLPTLMEADLEKLLNLLDSYWFEYGVFEKKPSLSSSTTSEQNPVLQIHKELEKPKLSRIQTHHVRSLSDQFLSSKDSFSSDLSLSPNSVLFTPKLETILSGKEVGFSENFPDQENLEKPIEKRVSTIERNRRRKRKGKTSKSLSDLEFQELKGFMDLGFVFSEEDKNSSLVSIIPGLQRLGRKEIGNGVEEEEEEKRAIDEVSRPYLSEAWDDLDEKKRENPLMNWRIPSLGGNEIDIKDHLRFWAHTVASTVT